MMSLFIAAGCNLPSKSNKIPSGQNAVTEISMDDLVKTAQAEAPFVPETNDQTGTDGSDLLISRDHGDSVQAGPAEPTPEPTPTKDPNRQPPELPAIYVSDLLLQSDSPH